MGLPLAHWMPIVTDLLQVATNGLPRCCGLRIPKWEFPFRWGYERSTAFSLYFFSLLSLSVFYVRKNHKPFRKTWLAYTSNHIIGSSDPRDASGRFRLGAILGNLFVPVFSTRGVNFFVLFAIFYWSEFCFCTSQNGKENLPFWFDVTQIRL